MESLYSLSNTKNLLPSSHIWPHGVISQSLERLNAGEGDNRGRDGWMASPTRWTWVWVGSGSRWWTGRPGVLQSMGSQRVRHDWVTELNYTWNYIYTCVATRIQFQNTAFPGDSVVKNLPINAGDLGTIPGSGRSPGGGHGNPLQYCCLENPMDRGAWCATVHEVTKSQIHLSD